MTLIPNIKCPNCFETSKLTEFISKANIIDEKYVGYCPKCKQLCYVDVSCTITASVLPSKDYLAVLQKRLESWEDIKTKESADIELVLKQIKKYKDRIKKWSKLEKKV